MNLKILKNANKDISYEIDKLNFTFNYLQRFNIIRDNDHTSQIYLEAFIIHFRNLYHFLFTQKKKRPDDIIAFDYASITLQPTKKLERIKKKASKLVMHITKTRQNYRKINRWEIFYMKKKIDIAYDTFKKFPRQKR